MCFAPVLSLAEAPQHPHNVERGTFVELDGVVQPAPAPRFSADPGRASSARRRTPASTPTRCSPSGASTPTASPSSARPAPSRSDVGSLRGDGDARLLPRPPRRRVDRDRRHAGQGGRRRPPGGARVRHRGRARRGRRRLPRRRRDALAAAGEGDRARRPRSSASTGRVPRLRRLRDDGHARERRADGSFWQADVDEAAERLAAILRDEERPTSSRSTTTTATTGTPTTSRCTASACGPPSWPARRGCSRARSTATTSSGRCWRPPRRATLPGDDAPDPDDFETFGRPEAMITTTGRRRATSSSRSGRRWPPTPARSPSRRSSSPCPPRCSRRGSATSGSSVTASPEDHRDDDLFAGPRVGRCSTTGPTPRYAQQLVFGAGSLDRLPAVIKAIGARRAMLVTTAGRLASPDGERVRAAARPEPRDDLRRGRVARAGAARAAGGAPGPPRRASTWW